jgi:hypothetical protein
MHRTARSDSPSARRSLVRLVPSAHLISSLSCVTSSIVEYLTGGSSERIFLYYATVRGQRPAERGDVDREDIEIKQVCPSALFELMDKRLVEDAKLLIGTAWLRDRLRSRKELLSRLETACG